MKGNRLTVYSIFLATLIYIIIFKMLVLEKYIDLSMYISLFFTFTMFIIGSLTLGFSKEKKGILRYSAIQTIIIYTVIYYILIYIFGIFVGFLKSIYSLNIVDIFENIYLIIPIIIFEELLRYILVSKSKKNMLRLSIITILFVILNIIMEINYYNFNSFESIFKFIALSLLPALASNALLTFTANKVGYLPNIFYRLILEIPVFLLPIFPNIGEYLECILGILLPFLIFVKINNLTEQLERIPTNKMSTLKWYVVIPVVSVLVALVILVSGFFKYHMIAVGSNSMYPTIKRGDAIILMKLEPSEIQNLQKGEVLVFRHDNKVILHRIVDVVYKNGEYQFTTKGDNNNANDNFITTSDNVIGIVKVKIPVIGYPTVFLNDMFTAD